MSSPAARAARLLCDAATADGAGCSKTGLAAAFTTANRAIAGLNVDLNLRGDGPPSEDFASTVGAAVQMQERGVDWAYIGDSGVALLDCTGAVEKETPDDIEPLRVRFPKVGALPPGERHLHLRALYRNPDDPAVPGFGVLTGEPAALRYVQSGSWEGLSPTDVVVVFSDGFRPFLRNGLGPSLALWAAHRCTDEVWADHLERVRRLQPELFTDEATLVTLTANHAESEVS